MADRNERHFREFYTPARQRISLLAARRQMNTELQQKTQMTPFSDDKENPSDFGAVPATIAGEKAAGIGKPRRRLFTRSASKPKYAEEDLTSNDEISKSNATNTYLNVNTIPETSFASPPVSGSNLSRALFSTDGNTTPMTYRIDENAVSPQFYSPPGSSNLLREYRSKQSLLSSSKTRTSSFSSPLARLRPSSLFKKGKGDIIIEEGQERDSNDNPLVAAIERSKAKSFEGASTNLETLPQACLSPTATVNSSTVGSTPSATKMSPITPKTAPTRSKFWSPPGTSKLLRKHRQRTQQLDQDPSAFQSPEVASQENHDRSQTTPRGRKGLRLLDSGAKRVHRLTLRPRQAANEVPTPTNSKRRARIKTKAKAKESAKMTPVKAMLSPSTAKRLNKDINSYRQAHGRLKLPCSPEVTEKDSPFSEEEEAVFVGKSNEKDESIPAGLETSPYPKFAPASSPTDSDEEHAVDASIDENSDDALPFDEHNAENLIVNSRPNEAEIAQDTSETEIKSLEQVATNPSDEETTEGWVFRSTRSATKARRDAANIEVTPAKIVKEDTESGVFRSTRSATRARRESAHEDVEPGVTPQDDNEEVTGVFRSTRSATKARRNINIDDAEKLLAVDATPDNTKENSDEESGVFRSTRSATKARLKAVVEATNATADETPADSKSEDDEDSDEESDVFRSALTSPTTRRISLLAAEKAVSAAEASISGKITTIDNSLVVDTGDSKSDLPSPEEGNDTPSSKGSLQSIWDVLHCGVGEKSFDSSENRCDSRSVHADIVSRVGDCVNPVATTLMNMWREEEKAAVAHKEANEPPNDTLMSPPRPTSFSTDLNLVYGLERVQNLTLARPKALQATRSTTEKSPQDIVIPPLAPCSQ